MSEVAKLSDVMTCAVLGTKAVVTFSEMTSLSVVGTEEPAIVS